MHKLKKILIPLLVVLVSVLVIVTGILVTKYIQIKSTSTNENHVQESWSIYKITPVSDLFNITLKSSSGIIRDYADLNAFGISPNGQYLAFFKEKQLNLTNLNSDTTSKITISLESIKVSTAESINWDYKSENFSLTILDTLQTQTYIVLGSLNSKDTLLIKSSIPYSTNVIDPAIFSTTESKLVVRTYALSDAEYPKENGEKALFTELPIYLSLYNLNGDLISSTQISDFSAPQYLSYGFDNKGRVKYYLSLSNIETYIPEEKYTKIQL